MKTRLFLFAVLVLALATVAMAADDPFVGTWKLNVRIPLDVVQAFHLKLSTHSIRCCPPIPVEVVH